MGSEYLEGDQSSRRRKYDDDPEDSRGDRKRSHHDERSERHSRRYRSRDRVSRRSRSPDSRDRRSRSRDRERRRERGTGKDARGSRNGDQVDENRLDEERPRRERDHGEGSERETRESRRHRSPDSQDPRKRLRPEAGNEAASASGRQSLVKRSGPLPSQGDTFAISTGEEPEKPVEKPNFGTTGLLAAASNTVTQADGSSVTLKYHEPPEARKPAPRAVWKLFVFKGPDIVDTIELSNRSCWLIGRDSAVVDLLAEHPTISKQHAVIQFRYIEKRNQYGDKIGRVKPYLIDLESGNGTSLNNEKVPNSRYLELRDKDMIQFGSSTREYVLMLAPRD